MLGFDHPFDLQYPQKGYRTMPKKQRKTPKKKTSRTRRRSATATPKSKARVAMTAAFAPAAIQKFVNDVRVRGESGPLKHGKLQQGLTHIENKKGSATELTRARFTYTGL
jgi:hypothetical protein